MSRRDASEAARLLQRLRADPAARLVVEGDGGYTLAGGGSRQQRFSKSLVRPLMANGLLRETEPGRLAADATAEAWLTRKERPELGFRGQHGAVETATPPGGGDRTLMNLDESPVAALARRRGRDGPWLSPHAATAADRLRRDFEIGQLQPRVTANWSASVSTGRRAEGGKGLAELTDMALAARLRCNRAVEALGPELSGVALDVCCFLKGLETVERERRWPARSAKLVLRLALEALARHYGLSPAAAGQPGGGLRHWGAADYRPEVT